MKFEHPRRGSVEAYYEASDPDDAGILTLSTYFHFLDRDEGRVTYSKLRFVTRQQLEELMTSVGLRAERWLGDWAGSEFTEKSPEIIPIARRIQMKTNSPGDA